MHLDTRILRFNSFWTSSTHSPFSSHWPPSSTHPRGPISSNTTCLDGAETNMMSSLYSVFRESELLSQVHPHLPVCAVPGKSAWVGDLDALLLSHIKFSVLVIWDTKSGQWGHRWTQQPSVLVRGAYCFRTWTEDVFQCSSSLAWGMYWFFKLAPTKEVWWAEHGTYLMENGFSFCRFMSVVIRFMF